MSRAIAITVLLVASACGEDAPAPSTPAPARETQDEPPADVNEEPVTAEPQRDVSREAAAAVRLANRERRAVALVRQGRRLVRDENLDGALASFREAVSLSPSGRLHCEAGWVAFRAGEMPDARQWTDDGLYSLSGSASNASLAMCLYNRGRIYEREATEDEAANEHARLLYSVSLSLRPNRTVRERLATIGARIAGATIADVHALLEQRASPGERADDYCSLFQCHASLEEAREALVEQHGYEVDLEEALGDGGSSSEVERRVEVGGGIRAALWVRTEVGAPYLDYDDEISEGCIDGTLDYELCVDEQYGRQAGVDETTAHFLVLDLGDRFLADGMMHPPCVDQLYGRHRECSLVVLQTHGEGGDAALELRYRVVTYEHDAIRLEQRTIEEEILVFYAPSSSYAGSMVIATSVHVRREEVAPEGHRPSEPHTANLPTERSWSAPVAIENQSIRVGAVVGDSELADTHVYSPTPGTWSFDECCLSAAR